MTCANRENILRKIRGLQSKTTINGCTEQEAMAASEMMGKLLLQYNLTLSEVEIRAKGSCEKHHIITGRKTAHAINRVLVYIAYFTDTEVWVSTSTQDNCIIVTFFGHKQDTLAAEYLYHFAFQALEAGAKEATARRITKRTTFMYGMADRMSATLHRMKLAQTASESSTTTTTTQTSTPTPTPTPTALMAIKNQVVKQEMAALKLSFAKPTKPKQDLDRSTYLAGAAAGDKVTFNTAIA